MRKHPVVLVIVVLGAVTLIALGNKPWPVFVTAVVAYTMFRIGMALLGGLARPIPEPPPAGELRKVKIAYRCSICGTEVRMTISPNEEPIAPRHCLEDMDMVTPVDDL